MNQRMGSSKVEYADSSHIYATKYARNSKAIGFLWGIFSICYTIIVSVAFLTPEWLGDLESEHPARFGLWLSCNSRLGLVNQVNCDGHIQDIFKTDFDYRNVSAMCAAVSVIFAALSVVFILFFCFCSSTRIYKICAWLQTMSAICLLATNTLFPVSWTSDLIQKTCGPKAGIYNPGTCSIKWAYYLAVIGCLDAIVLSMLAFILSSRQVKLQPDPNYAMHSSLFKGEINNGFVTDAGSTAGSRKSLNLHPVLLMPQPMAEMDHYSDMSSRTNRSKASGFRPEYSSNMHNFQL